MSYCTKDDRLWLGLVAFVVGAVVLLQRFDIVPAETWNYLWPSILVVSGIKWMMSPAPTDMSCDCDGTCDCEVSMPSSMPMSTQTSASPAKSSPKKPAKKTARRK